MTNMALIVPSRGRPDNIKRLYAGIINTDADVHLYVGVDRDDEEFDNYRKLENNTDICLVVSPERKRFGPTLNSIARMFSEEYSYLSWCGDDHLPITKGWDNRYREELDKGAGIVYGNDLVMGKSIATQLAFTPDIVNALGYAVPHDFIHLYIDNYFMTLGDKIGGSVYLEDVIFQHLHPIAGKAVEDKTYKEANSAENWSNDKAAFERYVANQLDKDVNKILEYRKYVSG